LDVAKNDYFAIIPVYQDDVDFHQVCAQLIKENPDLSNGTAAVFRIVTPSNMLQRYTNNMKKYGGHSRRIICYIDQQADAQLHKQTFAKCFPDIIVKGRHQLIIYFCIATNHFNL
jgi:hypothetical protein